METTIGSRMNGEENGNYYNGLSRDYYKDPFLPESAKETASGVTLG